ncbi:MAG TPA: aquaporin [Actinomycetes bacterium]|nr:aquaporin [Actinomycetes bacterium]
MTKKLIAELIGTFALVFLAVGAAVTGIADLGGVGVALGFGLVLTFLVFAIGPVSGSHVNPAVTLAMMIGRKMPVGEGVSFMAAQIVGAVAGAFLLWLLVDQGVVDETGGLGANSYGPLTGGALGAFILETALTAMFVFVVLMVTEKGVPAVGTGLAIGAALTAVHLVGVPLTGTSVNPARSIGPALFQGGDALSQLWLFILAPLVGGVIAVGLWWVAKSDEAEPGAESAAAAPQEA